MVVTVTPPLETLMFVPDHLPPVTVTGEVGRAYEFEMLFISLENRTFSTKTPRNKRCYAQITLKYSIWSCFYANHPLNRQLHLI